MDRHDRSHRHEHSADLIVKLGRGFKLDRYSDQWLLKRLRPRQVVLSEELLAKRGWKFESLVQLCAGS